MKRDSYKNMPVYELWALYEEIISILEPKIETEKLKLERRLAELGLAPARELNRIDRPERRPYPKVHPKYRNPDRPVETWSGRGKQPRWVSALLQSGRNIEDLRVQRLAR
jgi:DNA-binding protein H-NS